MFERLQKLTENSYVPLSNYRTACIVVTKDGNSFEGVNVENPSFNDGLCAEQVALANACSHGYKKHDFQSIYIITAGDKISTPCFLCRQFISELCDMDTSVICYSDRGESREFKVSDICPYPFGEGDLI